MTLANFEIIPVDWVRMPRTSREADGFIKLLTQDQANMNELRGVALTNDG